MTTLACLPALVPRCGRVTQGRLFRASIARPCALGMRATPGGAGCQDGEEGMEQEDRLGPSGTLFDVLHSLGQLTSDQQ
jgi:hypothetical protein